MIQEVSLKKGLTAVAVAALLVLSAGCSKKSESGTTEDSKPLAKAELVIQADKICADTSKAVASKTPPGNPAEATDAQLKDWAAYFDALVPTAEDGLTKLQALTPEDGDKEAYDGMLAKFETVNNDAKDAQAAAKGGKLDEFKASAEKLGTDQTDANKTATDAGFVECGK